MQLRNNIYHISNSHERTGVNREALQLQPVPRLHILQYTSHASICIRYYIKSCVLRLNVRYDVIKGSYDKIIIISPSYQATTGKISFVYIIAFGICTLITMETVTNS